MHILEIVLLVLAGIAFLVGCGAVPVRGVIPVKTQVSFIALGLLFWVVAVLIPVIQS